MVLCRGEAVLVTDLPPELRDPGAGQGRQITFSVGSPIAEIERRMISETLKFTRGDKRLAADLLGIATRTIYRKLESGFVADPHPQPHPQPHPHPHPHRGAEASPAAADDAAPGSDIAADAASDPAPASDTASELDGVLH